MSDHIHTLVIISCRNSGEEIRWGLLLFHPLFDKINTFWRACRVSAEQTYELREYVASQWVSTTSVGVDYNQAQYQDFMRLFRYISGNNTKSRPFTCVTVSIRHLLWQGKQSVRWGILIYWYQQKALHLHNCLCVSSSLTRKTKCQMGHSDLLIPIEGPSPV